MSIAEFFDPSMKTDVAAAIGECEARTSAEIVVSVHQRSGVYREARWLAGSVAAFIVLLLLLFLPQEFDVRTMPLDILVAFGLGAGAAWIAPPIERWFTSKRSMRERVDAAAVAELLSGGTTKTRGRTGVLVYVSALEAEARVVFDIGLDAAAKSADVVAASRLLEDAVRRFDRPAMLAALRQLGVALGAVAPRSADDLDELPNTVLG